MCKKEKGSMPWKWINSDLKQLTKGWMDSNEGLNKIPPEQCTSKNCRLDGSSGISSSFL